MIYKKIVKEIQTQKELEQFVASCLVCGNDDIKITEYEDTYGFISTAKCNNIKCKNKEIVNDEIKNDDKVEDTIMKTREYNNDELNFIYNLETQNEEKINASDIAVIKKWNSNNDIPTIIENKKQLLIKTKEDIKLLNRKLKKQNKKQHG